MKLFLSIAVYVGYRILNNIFEKLSALFCRRLAPGQCEVRSILWKNKYAVGDIESYYDFLCMRERVIPISELLENSETWVLYSFSETDAYFVQTQKQLREYRATKNSFVYMALYTDAQKVCRVPLETFMAAFNKGDESNEMVFISMCPRSGSTLLTQMLDLEERTVAFNEPCCGFNMIAMQMEEGKWDSGLVDALLNATVNSIKKSVNAPDRKIVIKLHSCSTRLIPRLGQVFPNFVRLHTYKALNTMLRSNDRYLRANNYCGEMLLLWKLFGKGFAVWLTPTARVHATRIESYGAFSCWEFAFVYVFTPFKLYMENAAHYGALIRYEDIIKVGSETILEEVFRLCGVTGVDAKGIAESRLGKDSQEGSPYSQSSQNMIPFSIMTPEDNLQLQILAKKMGFEFSKL